MEVIFCCFSLRPGLHSTINFRSSGTFLESVGKEVWKPRSRAPLACDIFLNAVSRPSELPLSTLIQLFKVQEFVAGCGNLSYLCEIGSHPIIPPILSAQSESQPRQLCSRHSPLCTNIMCIIKTSFIHRNYDISMLVGGINRCLKAAGALITQD